MCRLMCYMKSLERLEGDRVGDFSSQNRCCQLSYNKFNEEHKFFECSFMWTNLLGYSDRKSKDSAFIAGYLDDYVDISTETKGITVDEF